MLRLFIAAALLLGLPALAYAQVPEAPASLWRPSDDRVTFTTAHISAPRNAGTIRFTRTFEFSHAGEGLDTGLQFESPDRQVFATLYVYYPGLAHAGLSAYATDQAIQSQSPNTQSSATRLTGAGGRDGIAIRVDYSGYRGSLASSAAYIKAGRWILKLRVSGPEARRAEVEEAMAALLAGLRFEGDVQPRPAAPLQIGDCTAPAARAAHLIPDDPARDAATALVGTFDGAGEEARDGTHGGTTILPARVGNGWCVSTRARIGEATYPILRAQAPLGGGLVDGTTLAVVPLDDAGKLLEAVRIRDHDRVLLLYHEIGSSTMLGSYDGAPSDEQIANILSGADEPGTRIRAVIRLRPGQGAHIEVPGPASPPATSTH